MVFIGEIRHQPLLFFRIQRHAIIVAIGEADACQPLLGRDALPDTRSFGEGIDSFSGTFI